MSNVNRTVKMSEFVRLRVRHYDVSDRRRQGFHASWLPLMRGHHTSARLLMSNLFILRISDCRLIFSSRAAALWLNKVFSSV